MARKLPTNRAKSSSPDLLGYLVGSRTSLVALAAVVAALLYLMGVLTPVLTSGPLPVPSRVEVQELHQDLENHVDTLSKTLGEVLEVAKAANQAAQNSLNQSNANRLDRLIQQKTQLEALLQKTPGDPALRQALTRTELDIGAVTKSLGD